MDSYAIIKTGGKQYRVAAGSRINVERIIGEIGSTVQIQDVLLLNSSGKCEVGSPTLANKSVSAKIVSHIRGPKVVSFKKRRRKGYTKKTGHRQELTTLIIESI